MSEDDTPAQAEEAPPANRRRARRPFAGGVERAFLRLSLWQTVLSLAGVFTGAVALYAALTESRAVRQQTEASVWPYVQFMVNDYVDDERASLAFELTNVGVGPARMRAMRLSVDGKVQPDWRTLRDELLGPGSEAAFGMHATSRRVLAPGESVAAFRSEDRALVSELRERIYSDRARLTYCYCSIFDSCWLVDSSDTNGDPRPLENCPDYGADSFRD